MTFPTILPSYVAGAEPGPYFIRLLTRDDAVINMAGYAYRVEVWWDDGAQISLSEGGGITRLVDNPDPVAGEFHYSWGLTEQQGKCLPVGLSPVKLFYISPGGITTVDVVYLKRTL